MRPAPPVAEVYPKAAGKYRRQRFADISSDPGEWLAKGLYPRRGVGVLYGASTLGKTFVATHDGLAISKGEALRGHKTRRSGVMYVAAEGEGGMRKRIAGARDHFGIVAPAFQFLAQAPNLLDWEDIAELAQECREASAEMLAEAGVPLGLVIIDTLPASMPGGDENSSEGMGLALAHAQRLSQAIDCFVLLITHPGKDETRGIRGWSGQVGNVDFILRLSADATDDGLVVGVVEKLKDGEAGERFAYRLTKIQLGVDEDGDPITTAWPSFEAPPAHVPAGRKLRIQDRPGPTLILRALGLLEDAGQTCAVPPVPGVPPDSKGVNRLDLRNRAIALGYADPDTSPDTIKRSTNRDIAGLIAASVLRQEGEIIWRVRRANA